MKHLLITVITILGVCLSIASCNKSGEMDVEKIEHLQKEPPSDFRLVREMKKATMTMKRLCRGVVDSNWVEIDIRAQEIKEGIGKKCVDMYRAENNEVTSEFVALRDKFVSAVDNLILCSKNHDDSNSKQEYDRLKESCDECHEMFNEDVQVELGLYKLTNTSSASE